MTSSAKLTNFCASKVQILDHPDAFLWVDGNNKISWRNGTYEEPRPNAFSLVQVKTCPGSTGACRAACYVHGLEKHAPDTHALYQHNTAIMRRLMMSEPTERELWARRFATWIVSNCNSFRWHVSGDVFSLNYARWIRDVCKFVALFGLYTIPQWIYTRSHAYLQPLLQAPRLEVNLSADRDNWEAAVGLAKIHGLRVCYMADGDGWVPDAITEQDVIFPDYFLREARSGLKGKDRVWLNTLPPEQRKAVCPVDYLGKSSKNRCGPCNRCIRQYDNPDGIE